MGKEPKPQHRSKGRRLTVETQQEHRSRGQFDDRLSTFGWNVNSRERDLGEDFTVDILDEGRSAGLAFTVQLKSTVDAAAHAVSSTKSHLAYTLEVNDVAHWSVAAHLVVICLWDVTTREGTWLTVPELLKQLEKKTPKWRKQKTVTARLPRKNTTDDDGLRALRHVVAEHNVPLVSRGKQFTLHAGFEFPATSEGRAAAESLKRTIDLGEPAEIKGEYIKEWVPSEWWVRLFGNRTPHLVAIQATPSADTYPFRIEIDVDAGVHTTDVDLRRVRAGKRSFVLATLKGNPISLEVILERDGETTSTRISLNVDHIAPDVFDSRTATELLIALRKGTSCRLVDRASKAVLFDAPLGAKQLDAPPLALLQDWHGFLEKLCFLSAKIRRYGTIKVPPGGVSAKAARPCEQLYEIIRSNGRIHRSMIVQGTVDLRKSEAWRDQAREVIANGSELALGAGPADGGALKVLNVRVPLGPVVMRHDARAIFEQVEAAAARGEKTMKFKVSVETRDEYQDWVSAAET